MDGAGVKSFVGKSGGATRVRDPESLTWANGEKIGNSHQMVPVHTLGINVAMERSVKISDENSDKDLDEKDRMDGRNHTVHF